MTIENIEYNLKLSDRKTLSLCISKDGMLEVRAPKNLPKSTITDFILRKKEWILKNTEKMKARNIKKSEFSLNVGDFLMYKGCEYEILPVNKKTLSFDYKNFYMPGDVDFKALKPALIKLYKGLAKEEIFKKVEYYSKIMNLKCTKVKINSAKTRWGSCSGQNSLNFSWKLILADEDTINYVVVHELAHTKEHNHSSKFWEIVAMVFPDYKKYRESLRLLQNKLVSENWD